MAAPVALRTPRLRRGAVASLLRRHPATTIAGSAVLALVVVGVFARWISPYDPDAQNLTARLLAPGTTDSLGHFHLAGTDEFGRDVLSRLIHGVQVPLIIGVGSALISAAIGLTLGIVAGYFRGAIDAVIGMLIDIQLSMPFVLVALMVIGLFGPGQLKIILVFALTGWATIARVARAAALTFRRTSFVEAALLEGAGSGWILGKHILPNALPPVVVVASVQAAQFVVFEAAFAFFGLGVPPPAASWGNMLADGREFLYQAWWLGVLPGLCIMGLALALNLIGDGLRDAIDPRVRSAVGGR